MEYLGFVINSIEMKLFLPPGIMTQLVQDFKALILEKIASVWTLTQYWETDFKYGSSSPSSPSLQAFTNATGERLVGGKGVQLGCSSKQRMPKLSPAVDQPTVDLEWEIINLTSPRFDYYDGCVLDGYPVLLEISNRHPILLPPLRDLLLSPNQQPHPLILQGHLQLAAWMVTGKPCLQVVLEDTGNLFCSHSWWKDTAGAYKSAWKQWSSWHGQWKVDPFCSTVTAIADYLTVI